MTTPTSPAFGTYGQSAGLMPSAINAPYGSEQYFSALANQNQALAQQQMKNYAQAPISGGPWDAILHPIEWAGSKMYQVYSDYVSHPLTTAMLMPDITAAQGMQQGDNSFTGDFMRLFSANAWDRAWADARHVSPGQVLTKDVGSLFTDFSTDALKKTLDYRADGSIIWDRPDEVQQYYSHGAQKYISGALDAGLSWKLDPLTVAGKGAGLLKDLTYTQAAVKTAPRTLLGSGGVLGSGVIYASSKILKTDPESLSRAQQAWQLTRTTTNLQSVLDSSNFAKFGDHIEAAKGKLGDNFAAWAANQPWAYNGGGALAGALAIAKSRDDINDVLRVAVGDAETAQALRATKPILGAQLENLKTQVSSTFANMGSYSPAVQMAAKWQMDHWTGQISDIEQQSGLIEAALSPQVDGSLSHGLNFNPTISPRIAAAKDWARGVDYRALKGSSGLAFMGRLAYNTAYVAPVRVLSGQSWGDLMPNGWIRLDDPMSYKEVQATVQNSKLFSLEQQQNMVSRYINAPMGGRTQVLQDLESEIHQAMAAKYGINPKAADEVLQHFLGKRDEAMGNVYSMATVTTRDGKTIPVDARLDSSGNMIGRSPVLSSQLANHHPMMDVGVMDRILRTNARAINSLMGKPGYLGAIRDESAAVSDATKWYRPGAIQTHAGQAKDALLDTFNSMWKANVLLRLGYGPRAIADDFMGQIARLGPWEMAGNTMAGLKGQAGRASNKVTSWATGGFAGRDAAVMKAQHDIDSQQWIIDSITHDRDMLARKQYKNYSKLAAQETGVAKYNKQLEIENGTLDGLKRAQAALHNQVAKITEKRWIMPNGQIFPGVFEGPEGGMYKSLNQDGRTEMDMGFGSGSSAKLNWMRAKGWGAIAPNTPGYEQAWARAIQAQIAGNPAAQRILDGDSVYDLQKWFNTPEGNEYYKSLVHSNMTKLDMADRIAAHVNTYLPEANDDFIKLRQAVASGASDRQVGKLIKAVGGHPSRPLVNGEQLSYGLGTSSIGMQVDKGIRAAYKLLSEAPINAFSRNPLAASLYHNYVNEGYKLAEESGRTHLSNAEIQAITSRARNMAVQDVKRFTYNMDYETKLTYLMRFTSPFFGPMQEPINRWARIIADKPEVLGKFNMLYNAPIRTGHTVDKYGQTVDSDGYSVDPATGKKTLVPRSEMAIRFQMPDYMAKALGLDKGIVKIPGADGHTITINPSIDMPISTLPLPFRNDPWFNPGEGPWVEMAANGVAQQNPTIGDTLQKLGILPFGIQKGYSGYLLSGAMKDAFTGDDTVGVNQAALQIMNQEHYQYVNGLRPDAPTWGEVMDKAQHYTALENILKGTTWLPVSMRMRNPYQFFTDKFNMMQAANPQTARQLFLNQYGASAYGFTQSLKKNMQPGVPATVKAYYASSAMRALTDKYPEYAAMIIGPDNMGGGYSPTVQKLQEFSGQRVTMSAQDAWTASQVDLGWQQYGQFMQGLTADLKKRGLSTFSDHGAEDLAYKKQLFTYLMASPTLLDGKPNPYENQSWAKAYYTRDPYSENDRAVALQKIANASELQDRPDIQGLDSYLSWRQAAQQVMAERQGEKVNTKTGMARIGVPDINSSSNKDLKEWFQQQVMNLIEQNPAFHELHDRYLSTDMFDHYLGTDMTNSVYGG